MASTDQAGTPISTSTSATSTGRGRRSAGQTEGKDSSSARQELSINQKEQPQQRKKRNRPKKKRGKGGGGGSVGGDRGAATADGASAAAADTVLGTPSKSKDNLKQKTRPPQQQLHQQNNVRQNRHKGGQRHQQHPPSQPAQPHLRSMPAASHPEVPHNITGNAETSAPGGIIPATMESTISRGSENNATVEISNGDDDGRCDQVSPPRADTEDTSTDMDNTIDKDNATKNGLVIAKEGVAFDKGAPRKVNATTNGVAPFQCSWTITPDDSYQDNDAKYQSQGKGPTAKATGELCRSAVDHRKESCAMLSVYENVASIRTAHHMPACSSFVLFFYICRGQPAVRPEKRRKQRQRQRRQLPELSGR